MKEFIEAFKALRHAPRALWMVIFAFSLDAMAYFGILPLMKAYLGTDIGIRPEYASTWVSIFTGALTLVMLFVGKPVEDRFGIRKGLLLSLGLTIVGRAVYGFAPFAGGWITILVSLIIVALGEGIMQPVAYAGVKRYTDAKNGAMGYAMLYAVMNLAIVGTGPMSSYVRTTYDAKHKAGASALTGFNAVNWTCFGITVVTALVFILFMTKKAEANVVRNTEAPKVTEGYRVSARPADDPAVTRSKWSHNGIATMLTVVVGLTYRFLPGLYQGWLLIGALTASFAALVTLLVVEDRITKRSGTRAPLVLKYWRTHALSSTILFLGLLVSSLVGNPAGVVVFVVACVLAITVDLALRERALHPPPPSATKSPFSDPRFLFFIFMLLPVRTLFAHQWLTMPEYVLRAYDHSIADKMEWLVDSLNPIIIFVGVPTLTALTRRFHVYSMMITGTLVSASATFLLCTGPHVSMLIAYFFVFSIGEAMWSSRFLEYAAELAPEGRVAQYMGVANLPWFVAKMTTGFYSGFILEKFCPAVGLQRTEMMWLIYGIIAMASPVGLILARKWVMKGMSASGKTAPA